MSNQIKPVNLPNVRIGFKNFEGREGQFNRKGERSFAVFLDGQTAETLAAQGWNVKFPKPNPDIAPEEDNRDPHIQVSVAFDNFPPDVYLIANENPTKLDGANVSMLDWAELQKVDLVIRPYVWSVQGNTGVKAYLKKGYFTIVSDQFTDQYGY